MLHPQTASVPTTRVDVAAPRGKGAGLIDPADGRPSILDDLNFDSMLSDARADRQATARDDRDTPRAEESDAKRPERTQRSRRAARDRKAEHADEASQPSEQAAHPEDPNVDPSADAPSPEAEPTVSPEQPVADAAPVQASSEPASQADPAVIPSTATAEGLLVADLPAVMAATPASAAGASASVQATPDAQGAAAEKPAARPGAASLVPLQWMAQQQAAKVNVKHVPAQPATAEAPQADTSETTASARPKTQFARLLQQAQAAPAGKDLAADQPVAVTPVAHALERLTEVSDKLADRGPAEPASAVATSTADAGAPARSATSDPNTLLSQIGLPVDQAASRTHSPAPAAQVAARVDAGAASLVPAAPEPGQNVQRMVTMVHAAMGRQQSTARMLLQPPELGAVTAVLQLRQNRMELKLEVANEAARDLVTHGLDRLRDSLQQQGISLDRTTVSIAPRSEQPSNDSQQQHAWQGRHDNGSGMSDPGHDGRQSGEQGRPTSFAVDLPAAAASQIDAPAAAVAYAAGLNLLA